MDSIQGLIVSPTHIDDILSRSDLHGYVIIGPKTAFCCRTLEEALCALENGRDRVWVTKKATDLIVKRGENSRTEVFSVRLLTAEGVIEILNETGEHRETRNATLARRLHSSKTFSKANQLSLFVA